MYFIDKFMFYVEATELNKRSVAMLHPSLNWRMHCGKHLFTIDAYTKLGVFTRWFAAVIA